MTVTSEFCLELEKLDDQMKKKKVLLAISGGVDSMVLLNLFQNIPAFKRPSIAVAHVNHQLRAASLEEKNYIEMLCKQLNIPFFFSQWQRPEQISQGLEAAARNFRYAFFEKLMIREKFDYLVTAHHGDDQAETILMKVTKGSQLRSLAGIASSRSFAGKQLLRPLLKFSKEQLYRFAKEKNIVYFEDETNYLDQQMRNRFRHHVIPVLKKENPQFLERMQSFAKKMEYANQIIAREVNKIYPLVFKQITKEKWQIAVQIFQEQPEDIQYFLFVQLLQDALVDDGVAVNENQVEQGLYILNSQVPHQELSLAREWHLKKSYTDAILENGRTKSSKIKTKDYSLQLNKSVFLSENEWLGIFDTAASPALPTEVLKWEEWILPVYREIQFPLSVRHREAGDRIQLKQEGYHKKINRIMIDQKLPLTERKRAWLVETKDRNILWLVPRVNSYLSIPLETDKIHYRLTYRSNFR